ncbi:hypothetical protein evm_002734 [Chilo suppressalis]|nr:hypothetical protein evm_002734 [Chilo suppressalis]
MLNLSKSMKDNATDLQQWTQLLQETVNHRPDWIRILYLIILFAIFVVGVTGNLLTCVVIYFNKTMHTATNCYLFTLAVSDLLVSFGIILEIIEHTHYDDILEYRESVCKVHFFLVVTLFHNGILIMTALSIERYIAIWHPLLLNSRPLWKRIMKIIILIWTLAILETFPEVFTVELIKTRSLSICCIVPSNFARWLNGVLAVVNFIIPLTIMIFVYAAIAVKVNMAQRSTQPRDKIFNHRNNTKKVNKLVVALTLSFIICWLPIFTMRVLIVFVDFPLSPQLLQNWDILFMLTSTNSWFTIVLNPILFSLMSTKFREALKSLWDAKFKRKQTQLCVADGTRTRTLRSPGECTDQLCYRGPDGHIEILLAILKLQCSAISSHYRYLL